MFNKYDAMVTITVEGTPFTAYLVEKDNKAYLVEPATDRIVFTLKDINNKSRYQIHTSLKKAARWIVGRDKWLGKLEKDGIQYVGDSDHRYERPRTKPPKGKGAPAMPAWKAGWGYEKPVEEFEEDTNAGVGPRWRKR